MQPDDPVAAVRELKRLSRAHNLEFVYGDDETHDWDFVNASADRVAEFAQMLDELKVWMPGTAYMVGHLVLVSVHDRLDEGVPEDDPAIRYAVAQIRKYRKELDKTMEMELMSGARKYPTWMSFLERHVL